jgi:chaperone modulatory protein CbpM
MFNGDEFCGRANIQPATLEGWIAEGWLMPRDSAGSSEFSEIDIARARLIIHLSHDLGVNDEGVGVILDLVDQIHGLRALLGAVLGIATDRSHDGRTMSHSSE